MTNWLDMYELLTILYKMYEVASRNVASEQWVVAVDVGGTFTDAMAFEPATGTLRRAKASTTSPEVVRGVAEAIAGLDIDASAIVHVLNGTTVVTNALLTRSGARTALLTTAGFEDSLESGRERRVGGGLSMYDLRQAGPRALVDRFLRFPVRERLTADGRVLTPLSRDEIVAIAGRLRALEIEAVAVCFLFSYVNAAHERLAAEILRRECPELHVEMSSDIAPEIREYERASTTVINAYTRSSFDSYVVGLRSALVRPGSSAPLYVMQASGGLVPTESDTMRPVQILESGPSAGLIGAAWIGRKADLPNVIALDIGGTTAKAGLVRDGRHGMVREFKADTYYPVRVPSIDLAEIGIGGGSIARIDKGGSLKVGPNSAGANPGPVCYGRGGEQPTVTDAALVLGRLRPDGFLCGGIALDPQLARAAIEDKIARPLSLDVERAAAGILRVAMAQAASAVQLISTKRGVDPRDFSIVAYGGAGPLQACEVALELGVPRIIVPVGAATFSAFGMMVADRMGDASATLMSSDPASIAGDVEAKFRELEARAAGRIGLPAAQGTLRRTVYARYVGQRWELPVPVAGTPFDARAWADAVDRFHAEHEAAYAFHDAAASVEMIQIHVDAVAPLQQPDRLVFADATTPSDQRRGSHSAWTGSAFSACAVLTRADLRRDRALPGPALIEDPDTTVWVPPGSTAEVDPHLNIIISLTARSAP